MANTRVTGDDDEEPSSLLSDSSRWEQSVELFSAHEVSEGTQTLICTLTHKHTHTYTERHTHTPLYCCLFS